MDKRIWKPLAMTLAVSAASVSYAQADVDIDNDGLIEISTLQELDLIRHDLAGTSLNGDSTGCPATGCNGYELVADLDFDTNGNGVFDSSDEFWNGGQGWVPVGWNSSTRQYPFTGTFEGNSNTISHLNIVDLESNYVGLFSKTDGALIQNLTLSNPTVTLSDGSENYAGTVAGRMDNSQIQNVIVDTLFLAGYGFSGGVVGSYRSDLTVSNIHASGEIDGRAYVGGVFGAVTGQSGENSLLINDVSFDGYVYSFEAASGLIALLDNSELNGCSVTGDVESNGSNTGGLSTRVLGTTVSDCHIQANVRVLPLEDRYRTFSYFTGGFFAEMGSSTLMNSSFVGSISSIGRYSGGVAGGVSGASVVNNVSVESDISASDCCTGGVFGVIYSYTHDLLTSVDVDKVIITGSINSGEADWVAGIFGAYWVSREDVESKVSIGEVYWDTDLSGVYNSGVDGIDVGGEGKTTFELQCPTMPGDVNCDASMYSGWDDTIWDFGTASDYPVLR